MRLNGNVCLFCSPAGGGLNRAGEDLWRPEMTDGELLGIGDRVGQIRPGFAADFVAVAADPLADLETMRTISLVVQGGRVVRDGAR
jgi:hypothetical protein